LTTTLHIISAGAAKGLVQALEPDFAATYGVRFETQFGAVGAMRDRLLGGDPCDLIILSARLIDALATDQHVDRATIAAIGDVETGIAVPDGAPLPRVDDAAHLKAALSSASAIYLPDPEKATAGIHFVEVLRKLGIHDAVSERLRPFPNGATAMRAMADAGMSGAIGCTQVTEIRYTAGVVLAGVLPAEFSLKTTYSLGVCTAAREPALARAFAASLCGPESRELRERGGFIAAARSEAG
jgi:molybdate transport system substrate-binding protein